jgi:hypothetical protein
MSNYLLSRHMPGNGFPKPQRYRLDQHLEPASRLSGLAGRRHRRRRQMQGLGDLGQSAPSGWLSTVWGYLVGQPQSYYDRISQDQTNLNVLLAGVTAVGESTWDGAAAVATPSGPTDDSGADAGTFPSPIDPYATAVANIQAALTSIIITSSNAPSSSTLAAAEATLGTYNNQLYQVQQIAPSVTPQVYSDQATVEQGLKNFSLQSPAVVGAQVFQQTLAEQAQGFGSSLVTILTWVGVGLGAYFIWDAFFRGKKA